MGRIGERESAQRRLKASAREASGRPSGGVGEKSWGKASDESAVLLALGCRYSDANTKNPPHAGLRSGNGLAHARHHVAVVHAAHITKTGGALGGRERGRVPDRDGRKVRGAGGRDRQRTDGWGGMRDVATKERFLSRLRWLGEANEVAAVERGGVEQGMMRYRPRRPKCLVWHVPRFRRGSVGLTLLTAMPGAVHRLIIWGRRRVPCPRARKGRAVLRGRFIGRRTTAPRSTRCWHGTDRGQCRFPLVG